MKDVKTKADGQRERIRVRATRTGYYEHVRRREGDVFTLIPRSIPVMDRKTGKPTGEMRIFTAKEQFSEVWMELAPATARETVSTSKQHITKVHDAIIRENMGLGDPNADDEGETGETDTGGEGSSTEVL